MNHKETLIAAAKIIDARGNEYGDMVETHRRIARLFNDMVPDVQLTAQHVAAVLMAVKLARIYAQPTHDDSFVDLAAYTAFRSELVRDDQSVQPSPYGSLRTRSVNALADLLNASEAAGV